MNGSELAETRKPRLADRITRALGPAGDTRWHVREPAVLRSGSVADDHARTDRPSHWIAEPRGGAWQEGAPG